MTETVRPSTAAQVRAAEARLLAAAVPLMRRAAAALATVIAEHEPERMLVLAGPGGNGGDALFAAGDIAARGVLFDILRTSDRVHEEALQAAMSPGATGIRLDELMPAVYVVVDGILGIGARRCAARRATPTPVRPTRSCSPRRRR